MPPINTTVRGAIKIDNLPERARFTTWLEFLEQLPDLLTVEVPSSISGVIVSIDEPGEQDRDKVWYRRDSAGRFVGVFAFQGGGWNLFYQFAPQQVIWTWGDSNTIPDGFTLIDVGDTVIPNSIVLAIKAQFVPNPVPPGYVYFAIRFSGY